MLVSNCCGVTVSIYQGLQVDPNIQEGICLKCFEHCSSISEQEFCETKEQKSFTIGKIRIIEYEDDIMLTNDDEGVNFTKVEFEELLKSLLYKHF